MNTTRKADLQRKLAMMEVPKPPAGLADRIKNDIPADLGATTAKATRRGGFAMRIAASLIIVVSSVYVGTRLMWNKGTRMETASPMAAASNEIAAKGNAAAPQRVAEATAPSTPPASRVDAIAPAGNRPATQVAEAPPRPAAAAPQTADRGPARASKDLRGETSIAYAPPPPPPAAEPLTIAQQTVRTADAAAPTAAAPAAADEQKSVRRAQQVTREEAAAAARVASAEQDAAVSEVVSGVLEPAPRSKTEAITVTAGAPAMNSARAKTAAASGSTAIARSRFGISTDPLVVERIRESLERGERPDDVNVEALVNYFAGGAEETATELALSVEGSPAPVAVKPSERLVRVSVDAPMSAGLTSKRIATDVQLMVKFDSSSVGSYRLIGGTQLSDDKEELFENNSVTALFAIDLKPGARARQRIVTIELRYRDVSGRPRTIDRVLKLGEFRQVWPDSSRRHRLASLGAIWGETLKYDTSGADVAKRAEELARQEPRDSKARELAQLATASSRLRSSGPTGSGR